MNYGKRRIGSATRTTPPRVASPQAADAALDLTRILADRLKSVQGR
jgi:hypothetical protein